MKILFAGTPSFAALHLDGLLNAGIDIVGVITQPDKAGKRGKRPVASAVKKLAIENQLKIIQPPKLNVTDIQEFKADLLIVVAYGQILREPVLNHPTYGCINVHGSLLPRWRGAAPIQRAILAGDSETGICIIQMDKGLDTGDILATRRVEVKGSDTSQDLMASLSKFGIDALIEVVSAIKNKKLTPKTQSEVGVIYAHKITKDEAQCNWQLSAQEIYQAIRAFNPDPICFTYLKDLRVKIHQAHVIEATGQHGKAGEVLEVSKQGILVACGTGILALDRLQLPLGKGSILSPSDILNARSDLIHNGIIFGEQ